MTKRDLKSLVIPLFTIALGKKLFDDKKSAFIAVLIAPLKRVRRMVISVGFAKTVTAIVIMKVHILGRVLWYKFH